jgi:hypothetical protein
MRTITITASSSDNCGGASWVLTSVTGNDGTVAADINAAIGTAPASVMLRAKRTNGGRGRTYTLLFTATDDNGNVTVVTRTVFVPLSGSKPALGSDEIQAPLLLSTLAAPNPFAASTAIRFELADAARVSVRIYDDLGKEVVVVLEGELGSGSHEAIWNGRRADGSQAPSGRYYYRIESGDHAESGVLTLVR